MARMNPLWHVPKSDQTAERRLALLPAPLWRRCLAGVVDGLLLLPLLAGLAWLWVVTFEIEAPRAGLPWLDWLVQLARGDDPLVVGGALVALLLWVLLRLVTLLPWGTTPGLALLGLRLVDEEGSELAPAQAATRAVTALLSALFFFLGTLWVIFDSGGQTLQDKVAGARVVRAKHSVIV